MASLSDMMRASAELSSSSDTGVDLSTVFSEEPVSLDVFIKDRKFLHNPPLSDVQYDAVRHIERIYFPELYPVMAKEFGGDYWTQWYRMTNFITLQWGKGCISGNTDIYNSRSGRWVRADEADTLTVQGVDARNSDGSTEHFAEAPVQTDMQRLSAQASAPFKRGRGKCVRVTTASGASIDVYVGHLFVSWESHDLPVKNRYKLAKPIWQRAGNLQVGDRIAVLDKLDCLEPVTLDAREVELVGYWIGDGSMPTKTSPQWGFYVDVNATDLITRYTGLVESYDGITAKHETMQSKAIRIRATVSSGDYSHAECAYVSTEHSESPYLKRGLCERHYQQEKLSGRLDNWQLSPRHNPLVDVIRKYGLYGSRAWDKRVPLEFFSLPDEQLAVFMSALWDTDGSIYSRSGGGIQLEYSTVSEMLARDIQRLLYRFGVVSRLTSKIPTYKYKGEKKEGKRAWRLVVSSDLHVKRLLSVLRLHGDKEQRRKDGLLYVCSAPQQVLDGDIYWDRVKSIEDIGDQDYWDMNVPDAGTYVAGGIPLLSSNSGKRPYLSCSFYAYCVSVDVSY